LGEHVPSLTVVALPSLEFEKLNCHRAGEGENHQLRGSMPPMGQILASLMLCAMAVWLVVNLAGVPYQQLSECHPSLPILHFK
jgi:hypothetical protein